MFRMLRRAVFFALGFVLTFAIIGIVRGIVATAKILPKVVREVRLEVKALFSPTLRYQRAYAREERFWKNFLPGREVEGRKIVKVGDLGVEYDSILASVQFEDGRYGVVIYYTDTDLLELPIGTDAKKLETATRMIPFSFDEGNWEAWIKEETGVILSPDWNSETKARRWICGGYCSQGATALRDFAEHGLHLEIEVPA